MASSRDATNESLIERLRKRAAIRRQIPTRKSVQEGEPDRIADLLEEAANALSSETTTNAVNSTASSPSAERQTKPAAWLVAGKHRINGLSYCAAFVSQDYAEEDARECGIGNFDVEIVPLYASASPSASGKPIELADEALSLALIWMGTTPVSSEMTKRLEGARRQIREALAALRG